MSAEVGMADHLGASIRRGRRSRLQAMVSLIFAAMVIGAPARAAGPREFFVSVDGNDAHAGTRAQPFATLERARDAIREMKSAGPLPQDGVTVWVGGGDYYLDEPFELATSDSGTESSPVVYRAVVDEQARLIGGVRVGGFEPVTDAKVLDRLDPASRGKVLQADLRAQGITDCGHLSEQGSLAQTGPDDVWPAIELSFDGRIMQLARWPNEGFARVDQLWPVTRGTVVRGDDLEPGEHMSYRYRGDRPARWVDEADPWTHGYHGNDWDDWHMKIHAVDPENRVIKLSQYASQHSAGIERNHRWYGLNLLCELDTPGEYYVDRERGILYFWPPGDVEAGQPVVSMIATLITLDDVEHVTIRGLTLESCRGTAMIMNGGRNNLIAACTVRNTGRMGIFIDGGRNHAVRGCDLYDIGDTAIRIVNAGDRPTLTRADHYIENNHIYRPGRIVRCHRVAISQHGVGLYARHNMIHDCPGQAILSGGNDNLIEFNEFSNCTFENRDSAYIIPAHTVIRHNFLHHLYAGSGFTRMIYMDVLVNGAYIVGNVFYGCYGGQAIHIGGSNYNVIDNNVFVDCHPALWIDSRTGGIWGADFTNIDYKSPPWSVRYPEYVTFQEEGLIGNPKFNRVTRNLCWGPWDDEVDATARSVITMKDNVVVENDPGFVDAEGMNFQLTDDALARINEQSGFLRIPFERIGCYEDELRASWPVPRWLVPERPRIHVVDVPYHRDPVHVDGVGSEWGHVPLCPIENDMRGGFLKLCWREEGLYGWVDAHDGTVKASPDLPWVGADAVLVYIEPDCARRRQLTDDCVFAAFNIRPNLDTGEAQISRWDRASDPAGRSASYRALGHDDRGIRARWALSEEGYVMEFHVPASALVGAQVKPGTQMGFNAVLVDDGANVESFYAPEFPSTAAPFTWGRIRLTKGEIP